MITGSRGAQLVGRQRERDVLERLLEAAARATAGSWRCTGTRASARRRCWSTPSRRGGLSGRPRCRRRRRDGARVRCSSAAVLAEPRAPRASAGSAARGACGGPRAERRAGPEHLSRRTGGPRPAVRGRRGATAALCRRRRAVARSCLGARPCVRGSAPTGREDRTRRRSAGISDALTGLPQLHVEPLRRGDPRTLLQSVLPGRLDEPVLERIVVETRGNPLALLELPRGLTPAQLAGGFGLPTALPLSAQIEESFTRRLARMPRDARRLLLVAAADSTAICHLSGGRLSGSGSRSRPCTRSRRTACWRSARASCSVIRWFVRRCTGRLARKSAARSTSPWRRRPIRRSTRIAGRGTVRRRHSCPMRTLPPSSSGLQIGAGAGRLRRGRRLPGTLDRVDA